METNRRDLLQIIGAGAAAMGLAAVLPSAAAQEKKRGIPKMIMRADDVGYTKVCNIGAFEALEHGVSTHADVMMDTPGAVDAFERLKAMPWISVGWHPHYWGGPVLDPKEVPSMVIQEDGRIRFRKDLHTASDVVLDEALKECRAEIERCVKILGRAPDTGAGRGNSPFARAMSQVCKEFGIVTGFMRNQTITKGVGTYTEAEDKKWASRRITNLDLRQTGMSGDLRTESVTELLKYDPYIYYAEDRGNILKDFTEDDIVQSSCHPGYVDYYVYRLGDYGPEAKYFTITRTKDCEAMCSDRMKNWIKQHRIELINYRDALYGTREYQNHLRLIGSDLCMI
jgi:predicted glycoside hydrolase/deacetylase ChbG (UPF0249 family)